jgi:putative tributyrin esterase
MRDPNYGEYQLAAGVEPGLNFFTFRSPALGRRGDVTLYVPPEAHTDAIALFLHGVYDSHWAWAIKGGAHRTAHRLITQGAIAPVILAMPSDGLWGDGSGYVPHADADYERWIVDDVIGAVRTALAMPTEPKLFITGLSMGGYGALRLGAKYASRFSAIAAHSSIIDVRSLAAFVSDPIADYQRAGSEDLDVFGQLAAHRADLPPLRFDCGADDGLLDENRALHAKLDAAGIAHVYREYPGAHEWAYWSARVDETLRFFDAAQRGAR